MSRGVWQTGPELAEKRAFLERGAGGGLPLPVEVIETHCALVFLAGDGVWKMKKPITLPHLDYALLDARETACREELRLNRALAGDVYRRVLALVRGPDGRLALTPEPPGKDAQTVDWLVQMRRLPVAHLLDHRLGSGPPPTLDEIERVVARMVRFYETAPRPASAGLGYLIRWRREGQVNATHLETMRGFLNGDYDPALGHAALRLIWSCGDEILTRAAQGLIVDAHGDLRPEHVCLTDPPVIFDRLEFDPLLRLADPYDEFNHLGLACAELGAPWIRAALLTGLRSAGMPPPSPRLLAAYGVNRCLARARLAIDHMRDPDMRTPWKWPRQARSLLALAGHLLAETPAARNETGVPLMPDDFPPDPG